MTEAQNQQPQGIDSVLAQSLPKPGVAEAMRFWHHTRPASANSPDNAVESNNTATD